jgi:hypothetical protein
LRPNSAAGFGTAGSGVSGGGATGLGGGAGRVVTLAGAPGSVTITESVASLFLSTGGNLMPPSAAQTSCPKEIRANTRSIRIAKPRKSVKSLRKEYRKQVYRSAFDLVSNRTVIEGEWLQNFYRNSRTAKWCCGILKILQ